jgi:hypothetical protein
MATTEERLANLEARMDYQAQGFSELREGIRQLEHRVDARVDRLEQRFDARFDLLDRRLMTTLVAVISGFVAVIASLLSR